MRSSCSGTGGEQVEGALIGEEGLGIEVLVRAWGDGIEHAGSASAARARETPCQMLSRVLGSASIIAASESSQPIAAFGWELRMATASDAALGSRSI